MTAPKHRRPARWPQAVLALLLIAAAAYTAGEAYYSGVERDQRAECQARVNGSVVAALDVRDRANRDITAEQRRLIEARLSDDDEAPAGITPRQADLRYLSALDRLQAVRDQNPIEQATSC